MVRDRPFRADREAVVFVSRRRRGFVSGGPGNPKGWREFPFRPRACSQGRKGNSAPIVARRFPATPAFVVARSAPPPFASSALGGEHPLSTDFMKEAGATNTASVKRALTALCASDLIYRHDGEYKFVSPFFGAWVRRR